MKLQRLRKDTLSGYTTFGCMWEKGRCQEETAYICKDREGKIVPIQSRITAYWPDGSVKWTAHTAQSALLGEEIEVTPGEPADFRGMSVEDDGKKIKINNGCFCIEITRGSDLLFDSVHTKQGEVASKARAVLQLEEPAQVGGYEARVTKPYAGVVKEIELEERGALQCILKFTGCHRNRDGEERMPFIIRMRINWECSALHFTHTFLYDGDEDRDFLKGLGISFETPLSGALYNRHVKFQGDHGVFHEAVVPLMSWRPGIPRKIYEAQMDCERLFPEGEELATIGKVLQDTPYWSVYDICQDSASHFMVRKKLKYDNCCYVDSLHGKRSKGAFAYGSEAGRQNCLQYEAGGICRCHDAAYR